MLRTTRSRIDCVLLLGTCHIARTTPQICERSIQSRLRVEPAVRASLEKGRSLTPTATGAPSWGNGGLDARGQQKAPTSCSRPCSTDVRSRRCGSRYVKRFA